VAERLGCDQSVLYTRLKANGYAGWRAFRWAQEGRTDAALRTARYKERQRTLEPNNHKVTAVRPAKPAGVYDLQVEETHNFALAAGVFVHNSTDTTQILESWGIEAKVQSIDRTPMPYQTLRDVMYDGRLEGYDDGIIVDELEGLTRLPNGKIDHPADGSKDEADSLAGAVMAAIELGGDEGEHPEVIDLDASFDLGMNGFGTMGAQAQDMSVDATSWGEMSWQPQA